MDLFAVILITITATTICGICLFIFVCAVQPRFLRKLHGKTDRSHQDPDSNENENEDAISFQSLDTAMESRKSISSANNREKRAYLKSLEQSLRTGRPMQDDDNNDHHEDDSQSTPLKFIRHYINKHIRRKTSDTYEPTEI